ETRLRSCAGPSAATAGTNARAATIIRTLPRNREPAFSGTPPSAAMQARLKIRLIRIGCAPCGHNNIAIAIGLHGRDQCGLLHLFEQTGGAVIANAQVPLYRRDGRTAVLENYFDGLIV